MQKLQDEEAREIEQSGLADKDAFAELKALAGEGGTMAHGEGLPPPPQPKNNAKVWQITVHNTAENTMRFPHLCLVKADCRHSCSGCSPAGKLCVSTR